jgi:hypothetical protein
VLRASAGQIMQVGLWSNGQARFLLWGADGTPLKRYPDASLSWQGKLPKTQDYYIEVVSGDQPVWFCLRTTVYARIQFKPGGTSATVSSPVQNCIPQGVEVVGGYVLRAMARQTMRVSVSSAQGNVYLAIVGADGVPLKRYDDWRTTWEGVLPTSQDYSLVAMAAGGDTRFSLSVWISPLGQEAPVRIRFAPGTSGATVSGTLPPGGTARYVLWAARGQLMEISVAPVGALDVTVTGPEGSVWRGLSPYGVIDPLPMSGDYTIALVLRPGWSTTTYRMHVTIPPR